MTQVRGTDTTLRSYEQDKFEIAEVVRSISNLFSSQDHPWQERLRELFVRLAEDRFNLVVVGRFNRGKTSIMNAILGTNRLPVGIVPLTSVITTVAYGPEERVVLKFKNSSLTSQIPIAQLPQYVTQNGNPGNVRGIKMAEVQLRAEILRRGFYFVDTPGLGSAIIENTRTTEDFLPEADAFLVVTSFDSPLTEEETGFLRSVRSSARRVFVAINKQDAVSMQERETVLSYVRDQLRAIHDGELPQIFSVSANDGLAAKQKGDIAGLAKSGISALEDALVSFLLAEKKDQFLLQMCGRVEAVIRDLPSPADATILAAQIGALSQRIARSNQTKPVGNVTVLSRHDSHNGLAAPAVRPAAPPQSELPSPQQFRTCEICTHVNDVVWSAECSHQYEISTNRRRQMHFAAAGGLCSFHTWQYQTVASSYGICTAYPVLLDHIAAWLRRRAAGDQQDRANSTIRIPVATPEQCLLCNIRDKAEAEAVSNVAHRLSKQGANGIGALTAICIPHLSMLMRAVQDPRLIRMLMEHEATLLERLSEDMKRFALKHNAVKRYLENKEEETAAERTLLLVAGHRNVTVGKVGIV